jgi:hypothetical protein
MVPHFILPRNLSWTEEDRQDIHIEYTNCNCTDHHKQVNKTGRSEATGSTFCAVKKLVEDIVKIDKILHIGYTNGYNSDQKEDDKNNFCQLLLQATRWYHIRAAKKLVMDRRR